MVRIFYPVVKLANPINKFTSHQTALLHKHGRSIFFHITIAVINPGAGSNKTQRHKDTRKPINFCAFVSLCLSIPPTCRQYLPQNSFIRTFHVSFNSIIITQLPFKQANTISNNIVARALLEGLRERQDLPENDQGHI
jgi:hypothetical protein